ncbi:MAG: HAD family phosphatase [Verrucomicrobiota bacterium]
MEFELPQGDFEGFIFDCDGTLADTMPLHFEAWSAALAEHDVDHLFPETRFYELGGIATSRIVTILNDEHGTDLDAIKLAQRKEAIFMERLIQMDAIESVKAFALEKASNHPVSVVSGGFKQVVLKTLDLIGMKGVFSPVITPEDVAEGCGKPHPDMFFLAAEKMGVDPAKCVVFEDGQSGIDGAHRAGMATVLIRSHRLSHSVR